jgi:DNA polymerase-3 subunit beta
MKIKIDKTKIKKILDKLQGLTNQKTSLNITKNVLIKTVDDNFVSFSATDLTGEFYCIEEAEIESNGEIAINSKKLFEIVKNYPDDYVSIEETDPQWIKIGDNDLNYNLVGAVADDFPEIKETFETDFFNTKSALFKKLLYTGFSINPETDENRTFILGINLNFINYDDKSCIKMFSTDTRRIVKYDIISDKPFSEDFNSKNFIVPKKILPDIIKFIDSEDINISFTDDLFIINQNQEYFSVNLLEGTFPDCNQLVRGNEEDAIEIDKKIFSDMLTRTSIVCDEKNPILFFTFSENTLTLNASNPELGEAKEKTEIEFNNEEFEIGFNPKFLLDFLKEIPDEKIKLYLKDSNSHCIIKGLEDNNFAAALMPIRI